MLKNGEKWFDTDGNVIHAHGGYIISHGGYYYWYGEDRRDDIYVSCYRSADLKTWEFRGHVLTAKSKTEGIRVKTDLRLAREDGGKVNIERPKVLYNEKTKKFVMWMHYENGVDYLSAGAAIATCDTRTGSLPITVRSIPTAICRATARFLRTETRSISSPPRATMRIFTSIAWRTTI